MGSFHGVRIVTCEHLLFGIKVCWCSRAPSFSSSYEYFFSREVVILCSNIAQRSWHIVWKCAKHGSRYCNSRG